MRFMKIKWENIFTIITSIILLSMTIKYIIINGFYLNTIAFDIVFATTFILVNRWCIKQSRKLYLSK